MDDRRFDDLARRLAGSASRRAVVQRVAGSVAGGLLIAFGRGRADVGVAAAASSATLIVRTITDTGQRLPGACFQLYTDVGAATASVRGPLVKSACDGTGGRLDGTTWLTNLAPGRYVLVENRAPLGYDPATERTVTLPPGRGRAVSVTNRPTPRRVTVRVRDAAGEALPGACVALYADLGNGVRGSQAASACDGQDGANDGTVRLTTVQPARYLLGESRAPAGYPLNPDQPVVVAIGQNPTVTVVHRRCPSGQRPCNGACRPRCPTGQVFGAGCQCVCPPGQIECFGSCLDPRTDPTACGGCDIQCIEVDACCNGVCCSGPCRDGVCDPCRTTGETCVGGDQCCSGWCEGDQCRCGLNQCRQGSDCCTGACNQDFICVCAEIGGACGFNGECCSGTCDPRNYCCEPSGSCDDVTPCCGNEVCCANQCIPSTDPCDPV